MIQRPDRVHDYVHVQDDISRFVLWRSTCHMPSISPRARMYRLEYNICPQNAARARTVVSGMPDQDQLIQIGLGKMH